MTTHAEPIEAMPVISEPGDFDTASGSRVERLVFNHRRLFMLSCLVVTIVLGFQAARITVNAAFDKVIPQSHPYIKNYFDNRANLGGLGNAVRVVVENTQADIFDPAFLEVTRKINDALFLAPGTDRAWMKSIWMSSARWTEVTEEGFRGGTVMPDDYDGSPRAMEALRRNLRAAGAVGSLVGTDHRSILISVPLLERNPETGEQLDYSKFAAYLEERIRGQYESGNVKLHIVGFAKLVGDLIEGLRQMIAYFGIAAAIASVIIWAYTRCARSTLLVLACSMIAVTWQLGLVSMLRFELDPYSILVPFLVFAIGVSHGAQKMNGIMQDVGRGTHKYVAARYTFRRLFLAGVTALLADAVGFAVLTVVDVPVIKDLALTASIGVAVLIFTNLLLLPVMLSYVGVSTKAAERKLAEENADRKGLAGGAVWDALGRFAERRWAIGAVIGALVLTAAGIVVALQLKIGDLDPGAPELRSESRYNRDVRYINGSYQLSGDQFVVIVKTPEEGCSRFETLKETQRLGVTLRQTPGVQNTFALSDNVINTVSGLAEGNPKWLTVSRNEMLIGGAVHWIMTDNPDMVDKGCSTIPLVAYLTDHKAETLDRVVAAVEEFAREHDDENIRFLLAAGPAGIEAVTNMVVRDSIVRMYLAVYGAVALLCMIAFRSWRAVVVALVPLIITSILCKALMVLLGIGLKVATFPVIALGVGIGVDYALYLLSVQLAQQRAGLSLADAYKRAVAFTGRMVALVAVTLAAGVITWKWSAIKFQADMGILLAFMFLWNMIGALVLIPALSHFLLKPQRSGPVAGVAKTEEMRAVSQN